MNATKLGNQPAKNSTSAGSEMEREACKLPRA
jgi:hypothetical protein